MSSKICTKCKLLKAETEFNFRYKKRNIRLAYCRDCGKNLTRNHYKNNKSQYLLRNRKTYKKHRELVVKLKQKPCADCDIEYPYYVMDFDHLDSKRKKFLLSRVHSATKKTILEEISKCDVVCSNCHRERTHQRMLKNKSNK